MSCNRLIVNFIKRSETSDFIYKLKTDEQFCKQE